jgi:hypothetical protein
MVPSCLKEYKFTSQRANILIERILKALEGQHMTRAELCAKLYRSKTSIMHYLLYLRGDKKLGWPRRIYIAEWRPSGGHYVPCYALGDQRDKKEPPRLSDKERSAQRMAQLRADPVKHEELKARRRELHNSPRPRETSLSNRILRHLALCAGQTSREIAAALDADLRCTVTNLQRLRRGGKARVIARPGKKAKLYWYLTTAIDIPDASNVVTVRAWVRPRVKQQSWASALGV